jgi:hypothetical protein
MGYDDSASKFVMISDATDTASVISGTAGTLVANIEGDTSGTHTGNVSGNITSSGSSVFTGTVDFNGATIQNFSAGLTGNVTGNADTATKLANSVNIGGVAFDGSASINLPGVNTTGNQDTSGNAATATKFASSVTIGGVAFDGSQASINPNPKVDSEDTSQSEHFVTFVADSAGTNPQPLKEDADFKYQPSTGLLSTTGFSGATAIASTSVTTPKLKSSAGSDMITESADHSDLAANPHQFNGKSTLAGAWDGAVQVVYKWQDAGLGSQADDETAGTLQALDGADKNLTVGISFPSGGRLIGNGDLGGRIITASNLTKIGSTAGAAVEHDNIAANAIEHDNILNGSVRHEKLATLSVGPENLIKRDATTNAIQDYEIEGNFKMGSLDVDNISLDGNTLSTNTNGTHDLTLDINGDITLDADGGDIFLKDNGADFGRFTNTGDGNIRISSGATTMLTGSGANATFAGTLGVAGAITSEGDITAFGSLSDITLKENIQPIENALDKVSKIRGVTFNYIDKPDERVPGVIAQELQEVLPEAVYETENGKLAVRYDNTIALLLEAIKELKEEVEELKGK